MGILDLTRTSSRHSELLFGILTPNTNLSTCVSVSPSTSARPVSRSVTPAGSCTASSTESSQMARCPQTKPSEVETTPSTPSSLRLALASTCPAPSSSTWKEIQAGVRHLPRPSGVHRRRGALQLHPDHPHHPGALRLRLHGRQRGHLRHLQT